MGTRPPSPSSDAEFIPHRATLPSIQLPTGPPKLDEGEQGLIDCFHGTTNGFEFVRGLEMYKALLPVTEDLSAKYGLPSDLFMEEFRRFLGLKALSVDGNGDKLGPTEIMDTVWKAAVLDTMMYDNLEAALGMRLHYRPVGSGDEEEEARKRRRKRMEGLYMGTFGGTVLVEVIPDDAQPKYASYNKYSDPSPAWTSNAVLKVQERPILASDFDGDDHPFAHSITVIFDHNHYSDRFNYRIGRHTNLEKALIPYAKRIGQEYGKIRSFWDGQRICSGDTPWSLRMDHEEIIEIQLEQIGC